MGNEGVINRMKLCYRPLIDPVHKPQVSSGRSSLRLRILKQSFKMSSVFRDYLDLKAHIAIPLLDSF